MSTDWERVRRQKFTNERPGEWPHEIKAISMNGLALLGIHTETGKLYWDGKEIVTKTIFGLGTFERRIALAGILIGAGGLILSAGRAFGLWH